MKHLAELSRSVFVSLFVLILAALFAPSLRAQDVGSLQGTVTDPSGAGVGGAKITATDLSSSVAHSTATESNGAYSLTQLPPSNYKVEIVKDGFKTYVQAKVSILVATPTLLDAQLELGSVSQQVVVESAAAPTVNTQDATVGNTFGSQEVTEIPILARNIVNLLTLEPGVVFTGVSDTDKLNMGSIATMDSREGVVDGIRGNQADVTLDGVDSNDWQNQSPFTSALPVTPDSVQEFRVTTTNANATNGLSGGAQVQMVTRSGSDDFHGGAYWYYRTTGTSANSWFNNHTGIDRPKLQRNQPGGYLGGPIKKDRAFFFLNNEERRDAIAAVESRTVPSDSLRDGVLIYQCGTPTPQQPLTCPNQTTVQGLTATHAVPAGYFGIPATPQAGSPTSVQNLDPEGIGVNPAMIPYMNLFPHGNDPTVGLDANGGPVANFIGYRFNAPELTYNNIYIARFDYNITADGHHSIFWRGSMEGLKTDLLGAQFPGGPASQQLLNNSRGFAVQYQGQLSSTVVNTTRYGYTREGIALSGANGPLFDVRSFDDVLNFGARETSHAVPVHEINDDLSKTIGNHTLQMGGVLRIIANHRLNEAQSFPQYDVNDGFCVGCAYPTDQIAANAAMPVAQNPTAITRAFMMLTAPITDVTATFFGNPSTGVIQEPGTPDTRVFDERSFEVYLQDSWRIRSNLTLTYGLRYGYETPVWEANGFEVAPSFDIMTWLKQRVNNMNAGIPSSASPLLQYVPAGKVNHAQSWYQPDYKDFGPRLALAYSPDYSSGILERIFGGAGKSSIRVGAGIFYDNVGQPIALSSDADGSPGTATQLTNNSQAFCLGGAACTAATPTPAPRFSGSCSLTTGCTGLPGVSNFVTPPTSVQFPNTPASDESAIGFGVDPGLRTPYSIHFNADIQRELPHHFVVDVGYVGTLGRRLLGKIDYAQYEDIRDPVSGVDMWTAFRQIAKVANVTPQNQAIPSIAPTLANGEPNVAGLSTIASIPWFQNMLPNMPTFDAQNYCASSDAACISGYKSLTPTQAFYAEATQAIAAFGGGASWSCALFPIDAFVSPGPNPPNVNSPWNTTVDPNGTGLVQFQPQFATLPGWTNWASSNYHSLAISVRKSVGIASFAANYVFSKSIDNASGGENVDLTDTGAPTQASNSEIENPFNHRLGRAVSDFNLRHNFNGDWVVTMPFGRGQRFFGSANRLLDAAIGGWEVSGAVRWHSGFPQSPGDGFDFPTNFFLTASGTLTGPVSNHLVRNGSNGIPNLFGLTPAGAVAPSAWNNFDFTLPGLPGDRNDLVGPAYAATDVGVSKRFRISERMALKFQVRAYNVFNSVNFDDTTLSLDPTSPGTFGEITGTAGPRGGAREMEFAARFEF